MFGQFQQPQNSGGGGYGRRPPPMSGLGAIIELLQGTAVSVEVFTRDAGSFGSRYLKRRAGNVVTVIFIYSLFWSHSNLDGMIFFGIAYMVRAFYAAAKVDARVKRGGPQPHSLYPGTPLLLKYLPKKTELEIKRLHEPALIGCTGIVLAVVYPPLGIYLLLASFVSSGLVEMSLKHQRERATDLNDAFLEQRSIVEQFRDMRGD